MKLHFINSHTTNPHANHTDVVSGMAGFKYWDHFLSMPRCFCKYSSHRPGPRNTLKEYWAKHAAGVFDRPLLTGIAPTHAERFDHPWTMASQCWWFAISVSKIYMGVLKSILGPVSKYSAENCPKDRLGQGRTPSREGGAGSKKSSPVTKFVTHMPRSNTSCKGYEYSPGRSWQLKFQPKDTTKGLQDVNFARKQSLLSGIDRREWLLEGFGCGKAATRADDPWRWLMGAALWQLLCWIKTKDVSMINLCRIELLFVLFQVSSISWCQLHHHFLTRGRPVFQWWEPWRAVPVMSSSIAILTRQEC